MSPNALSELTHIRHELRACLVAGRCETARALLDQLDRVAGQDRALRREHERWCVQFDLLATARLAA